MYKFKKEQKILKNKEFQRIYRKDRSFANAFLVVFFVPRKDKITRFGFVTGKKLGNAVIRNRIKRLMREACRLNQHKVKEGFDMIFIARNAMKNKKCFEVEKKLLSLLKEAKLLR